MPARKRANRAPQATSVQTPQLPGELKMLAVEDLLANPDNIREQSVPDPGVVANLKAYGIAGLLLPFLVTPNRDGSYLLVDGHDRLLAVREAAQTRPDLTHVPAIVRRDLTAKADQVAAMLRTGVHRRPLTAREQARGVQMLALAGLSERQITKRTGFKHRTVKAALTAATLNDSLARRATGLDLTQTAALAEFADDQRAVTELLNAAEHGPVPFDRAVHRLRATREQAHRVAARQAELSQAGVRLLTEAPTYNHPKIKRLEDLVEVTPDNHTTCPGHAVHVAPGWNGGVYEATYCADYRAHGHTLRYASQDTKTAEEQRAERRSVIANNRAMDAANQVRRTWIKNLLNRKTPPKGTARYIAETLTSQPHFLARWMMQGGKLLDELLGKKTSRQAVVPKSASENTCMIYTLGCIAAAHESDIDRQSWRSPDATTARWLTWLASHGYPLDSIEQTIVDAATKATPPHDDATAPQQPAALRPDDEQTGDQPPPDDTDQPAPATDPAEDEPARQPQPPMPGDPDPTTHHDDRPDAASPAATADTAAESPQAALAAA